MTSDITSPKNGDETVIQADVLIVGGGLVGGAMAIALAHATTHSSALPSTLQVAVVDNEDPANAMDAGFDGRASAIALGSRRVLEGIGVWDLLQGTPGPILDIRVSEVGSRHFLHYDHDDLGTEPLGHMVENRKLRTALFARLKSLPNIDWHAPNRVINLTRGQTHAVAELDNGLRIEAPLAIACDGRFSRTRKGAGIRTTKWGYGQTGIVCTVRHQHSHECVAHEHFLPAGPFAILPLHGEGKDLNRLSSIVWTERPALVPGLMAMDEADFLQELEGRFGDFLGELEVVGPRWSYPLGLQFARQVVTDRLALAGDASHAMHPIAGQGLNMGFRDVAALAEVVIEAHQSGQDIGSTDVLERYARWRNFDNTMMLAATDGITRLFSNRIGPLKLARNLGLSAVEKMPALKRLIMRQAMGQVGDLPRLMRGEQL